MPKGNGVASEKKIATAAELFFDGVTQITIAKELECDPAHISRMKATDTWKKTIGRLEALRQKAEAEVDKRQQLLYSTESDRCFDRSKQMMWDCATTCSKLMLIINSALDEVQANPEKVAALDQVKHLPNLIKATLALQQEAFGRHYDEIEALKILAEAGWLPRSVLKLANEETSKFKSNLREAFTGVFPDRAEEQGRGLTEETAAEIRALILGIQPADASAVSAEVESRQQPDQDL